MSEMEPLVMKVFVPFRTYSSPSGQGPRRGPGARHVRPGVGLGEAEGGEPVVLGLLHEMARLLLGAVQKDVAEGDEVRDEGVGIGGIHPGQLLEHHGAGLVA